MVELTSDWITEGQIDFEYKKYLLLAYLQQVSRDFDEKRLYPKFSELIDHYRNLEVLKQQKKITTDSFPKEISAIDMERFKIQYRNLFKEDEILQQVDAIVSFAMPEMRNTMSLGKELYEEVEDKVEIFPVGILPMKVDEGYLFLSDFFKRMISVYYYNITIFESAAEKLRGIHTNLVGQYDLSISNTYQTIKYDLMTQKKEMPAPATYVLEFKRSYPLSETMLPIAKRMLVKYLS